MSSFAWIQLRRFLCLTVVLALHGIGAAMPTVAGRMKTAGGSGPRLQPTEIDEGFVMVEGGGPRRAVGDSSPRHSSDPTCQLANLLRLLHRKITCRTDHPNVVDCLIVKPAVVDLSSSRNTPPPPAEDPVKTPQGSEGGGEASRVLDTTEPASQACIIGCHEVVDIADLIELEHCHHRICGPCLRAAIMNSNLDYPTRTSCPKIGCRQPIPDYQYVHLLSPSDFQTLITDGVLIRCPSCENVFEKVPGSISDQGQIRSLDGSQMTPAALQHHARNRFRCFCGVEFCGQCGTTPYHTGFDCDAYKRYSTALCRFCELAIAGAVADRERRHVCKADECQDKDRYVCKATLPCGHLCTGVAEERDCLPCLRCPDSDGNIPGEEFCSVCYEDTLSSAPCIQLHCHHIVHRACIRKQITHGVRQDPPSSLCPICRKEAHHPDLVSLSRTGPRLLDFLRCMH